MGSLSAYNVQPRHISSLSKPPPRLMYTQGIQGLQTSQSMVQTLLLLHSAVLGNHLQPVSELVGLIPVLCNQQKACACSTISIQISTPNHMPIWRIRSSHDRKLFKVVTFHLSDTFTPPPPSFHYRRITGFYLADRFWKWEAKACTRAKEAVSLHILLLQS